MYPFGSLPANLIAFSTFLRRKHGFRIGTGEVHDAARALGVVDLSDERAVRDALRPILSRSLDDVSHFDLAFDAFFFPGPAGIQQRESPLTRRERTRERVPREEHDDAPRSPDLREMDDAGENGLDTSGVRAASLAIADDADAGATKLLSRASYSPLDADAVGDAPELSPVEPAWRDAARSLVRRLHLGLTRRWRPAVRGRRFDLRRTLRASLQTGGEALTPRWLRRPRRTPRFVLLIDGSRSMSVYAQTALQLAIAIASETLRIEVFTFSTALQRVTDEVRRAAAGERRHLPTVEHAWGGGTSIGACLQQFLRRFGGPLLRRDTVVIIASDGLDVGDPTMLRGAMRELYRRSAGVVWLNPLLETDGYEPTARGMSAARPYIATFASVTSPAGLAWLSRVVRVRA